MTTPPTTDAAKLLEAAKDCLTKAKYFPSFAGSSELLARHVLATVPEKPVVTKKPPEQCCYCDYMNDDANLPLTCYHNPFDCHHVFSKPTGRSVRPRPTKTDSKL